MTDLAEESIGVSEVRRQLGSADLQVDRCRCSEIQNLADDVGRQEREGRARKSFGQLLTQGADVVPGRAMAILQFDLNIAILGADRASIVVGHVDTADRYADVVDNRGKVIGGNNLPDRGLDPGEL